MNKWYSLAGFLFVLSIASAARAAPIPAEKLLQNPSVSLMSMSPDGLYVSYLTRIDGENYLAIQDVETRTQQGILVLEDKELIRGYDWIDSHTLLAAVAIDGHSRMVVVSRPEGAKTWDNVLLDPDGYLVSSLPDDPEHVLISIAYYGGESFGLYKIPIQALRKGKLLDEHKVAGIPQNTGFFAYSNELHSLITLQADDQSESLIITIGNYQQFKKSKRYKVDLAKQDFAPVGLLSASKMAVLSNQDSDTVSLFEFDLSTQEFTNTLYTHKKFDLVDAEVSAVTGEVISVSYYDHGKLTNEYLDNSNQQYAAALRQQFPTQQFGVVAQNPATGRQIIEVFSSSNPGSYYLYDRAQDTVEFLLSPYGDLEGYSFPATRLLQVTSEDGTPIDAYITNPVDADLDTLLVMPHGGPVGVMDTTGFDPTVHYFVSRGFSVLKVNYRGSAGYGKGFREAGIGQWGKLIEEDISAALNAALAMRSYQHTCAMGASYGAYSSIMLALKHPGKIECVAGAFGVYDLPLVFNSSNVAVLEEERKGWENTIGKLDDSLFEVSPVYLVQDVNVPVLLIGGVKDPITPVEHTRRMEYVLRQHHKTVESVYYQSAGHGHYNWFGDWHEHTLTYQFLLESLGLPAVNLDAVVQDDKELIQREYERLAATFSEGDWVDKDDVRAMKFARISSAMGSERGTFIEGWIHENSEELSRDPAKAIERYQQASEQGYSTASYLLGLRNYDGKGMPQDYEKSVSYFKLAKKQGHDAVVNLRLARAYCLGHGVEKDAERCVGLLDLERMETIESRNEVTKQSYRARRDILAGLFHSEDLSDQGRELLKQKLHKWYDVNTFDVGVEVDDFGLVSYDKNKMKFSGDDNISRDSEGNIGVRLDVDIDGDVGKGNNVSMFLINWKMVYTDGRSVNDHTTLLWGSEVAQWYVQYRIQDIEPDVQSVTAQLISLDNTLMDEQVFSFHP